MLTKPGIDIKTEREASNSWSFFNTWSGTLVCIENETNATRCRLTSQSGENLPFFAHFTKSFFQALLMLPAKSKTKKTK